VALENLSQKYSGFYAPKFEVVIEGKKLPLNISKSIIDLTVEEKLDEGATFSITLYDDYDIKTEKFKWLDAELFDVGNKVTIKIGYSSSLSTLMEGNITSLEPSFFAGETPTLSVRGQDLSYDYIKRKSPARTFKEKSYSEIAQTIAKEAKLFIEVDKTKKVEQPIHKDNNMSYFTFLEKLAGEVGYQFKIDGDTVYFKKPADEEGEILTLELGKDIISFRPNLNTAQLYGEVEVRGHNPKDPTKPIIGRAKAGDERPQEKDKKTTGSQVVTKRHGGVKRVLSNVIVSSKDHANAVARAVLNKASDQYIGGDAEIIGIPEIRAGVCIEFLKMGKRFTGKYYVKSATHTINNSGYRTRITVKRNAT
jgi:phage protein D